MQWLHDRIFEGNGKFVFNMDSRQCCLNISMVAYKRGGYWVHVPPLLNGGMHIHLTLHCTHPNKKNKKRNEVCLNWRRQLPLFWNSKYLKEFVDRTHKFLNLRQYFKAFHYFFKILLLNFFFIVWSP